MSEGKRGWFAKPSWKAEKSNDVSASSQRGVDIAKPEKKDNDEDMFFRSGDTYAQIVAERKEKEKRKKENETMKSKKRESERMQAQDIVNIDAQATEESKDHSAKRPRISSESADTKSSIVVPSSPLASPEDKSVPNATQPKESIVIDLDDYTPPNPDIENGQRDISENISDDVVEGEDPELSELTRQARERAKRRQGAKDDGDEANPEIQVFIQPRIPNTQPLLIKRRYRQNFRRIINTWCEENKLDKAQASEVIFTWQEKRVFNVSTFMSLGITLDIEGLPILVSKDGYSEPMDKLVLVATTLSIQQEDKKRAEEEVASRAKLEVEAELEAKPKERGIRIILRSKAYEEHKLIVKPVRFIRQNALGETANRLQSTDIQKIITNYRNQFRIPQDKHLSILFDGEALNPQDFVKDTELADCDPTDPILLDVSIR
jgi:hypothetical protein